MAPEVLGVQVLLDPKMWSAPIETGMPYNFCLIYFHPSGMVEAAETCQALLDPPAQGSENGDRVEIQLQTFPSLTSMPVQKFTEWFGFLKQTLTHTHIDLYSLDPSIYVFNCFNEYNSGTKRKHLVHWAYSKILFTLVIVVNVLINVYAYVCQWPFSLRARSILLHYD